jgi:hypothetical protein
MSMVRMIVGGVATHADTHVAAVIDANGGILGVESFPADEPGFEALLGWLTSAHGNASRSLGVALQLRHHRPFCWFRDCPVAPTGTLRVPWGLLWCLCAVLSRLGFESRSTER